MIFSRYAKCIWRFLSKSRLRRLWENSFMGDEERAEERAAMVAEQIEARGVRDARVLNAMRKTPRDLFTPIDVREHAYEDRSLPIGFGQTISQPYMVALMTELLELDPNDRVLEIGSGSGYQAALLAQLAREVVSIERNEVLAERSLALLSELGFDNVTIVQGDGTLGMAELAPFDAIIVTAGGPQVPPLLKAQLAEGGRLMCPVGSRDEQTLVVLRRMKDGFKETRNTACVFVPLIGAAGWKEP
jgi:protein-L-isoaspartate(D-aspartate) O-methyltransferase